MQVLLVRSLTTSTYIYARTKWHAHARAHTQCRYLQLAQYSLLQDKPERAQDLLHAAVAMLDEAIATAKGKGKGKGDGDSGSGSGNAVGIPPGVGGSGGGGSSEREGSAGVGGIEHVQNPMSGVNTVTTI